MIEHASFARHTFCSCSTQRDFERSYPIASRKRDERTISCEAEELVEHCAVRDADLGAAASCSAAANWLGSARRLLKRSAEHRGSWIWSKASPVVVEVVVVVRRMPVRPLRRVVPPGRRVLRRRTVVRSKREHL